PAPPRPPMPAPGPTPAPTPTPGPTPTPTSAPLPGLTGSLAGAGSAAINTVDNVVEAFIRGGADQGKRVQALGGGVAITAGDDSRIRADTGGYALAVTATLGEGGVAVSAALGASFSENQIGLDDGQVVRALIEDARVEAAGDVTLSADSTAVINALAL